MIRAYVEAFNRGDREVLKALYDPDAGIQGVLEQRVVDKVAPIWQQLIEGYGIHLSIEGLIEEEETVAVRYTETGTFKTAAFGREPTGRSCELVGMEWFVISEGRIARRWGARDGAAQARQLGIPAA